MESKKYLVVKDKKKKRINYLEYDKKNGYNASPKKKDLEINGAISINHMIIFNPSFVDKIVDKKLNKHFVSILELLTSIEESDDDPTSGSMYCLNELARFKSGLINKYLNYLTKEKQRNWEKKIAIIEKELKNKIVMYNYVSKKRPVYEEKEVGKSR